ncbi:hypothetical protein AB1K91_02640 [Terribacillus sp. 179-K 1B1 HS]|uniref:hypothetical protein n=1 Tax=Terribacillus sp. 179-K 1B1 HS TaxID=3142388 RepID=UPI0039A1C667
MNEVKVEIRFMDEYRKQQSVTVTGSALSEDIVMVPHDPEEVTFYRFSRRIGDRIIVISEENETFALAFPTLDAAGAAAIVNVFQSDSLLEVVRRGITETKKRLQGSDK